MAADPLKNIRVVLCKTAHPGNIGAAARIIEVVRAQPAALVFGNETFGLMPRMRRVFGRAARARIASKSSCALSGSLLSAPTRKVGPARALAL